MQDPTPTSTDPADAGFIAKAAAFACSMIAVGLLAASVFLSAPARAEAVLPSINFCF
jgi:hypothetical protein